MPIAETPVATVVDQERCSSDCGGEAFAVGTFSESFRVVAGILNSGVV